MYVFPAVEELDAAFVVYNMPDIDTLVYVVHLQNGSTKGMILIPPFTNEHPPVEGKKGIWRKDFGDGSYLRYDYETLHLSPGPQTPVPISFYTVCDRNKMQILTVSYC